MIIRPATLDDALAIHTGAVQFAKFTGLDLFPVDENEFISAVGRIIMLDNVEILVAEHEGKVVCALGIAYGNTLWNPSVLIGEEIFWWSFEGAPKKAGYKLYLEARKAIKERGAKAMFRSLANSPESVDKLYVNDGLRMIEKVFLEID